MPTINGEKAKSEALAVREIDTLVQRRPESSWTGVDTFAYREERIQHELGVEPYYRVSNSEYDAQHAQILTYLQTELLGEEPNAHALNRSFFYMANILQEIYGNDSDAIETIHNCVAEENLEHLMPPKKGLDRSKFLECAEIFASLSMKHLNEENKANIVPKLSTLKSQFLEAGEPLKLVPQICVSLIEMAVAHRNQNRNLHASSHAPWFENALAEGERRVYSKKLNEGLVGLENTKAALEYMLVFEAESGNNAFLLSGCIVLHALGSKEKLGLGNLAETLFFDIERLNQMREQIYFMCKSLVLEKIGGQLPKGASYENFKPVHEIFEKRILKVLAAGVEAGGLKEEALKEVGLIGKKAELKVLRSRLFNLVKYHSLVHGLPYFNILTKTSNLKKLWEPVGIEAFTKLPLAIVKMKSGLM